MPGTRSSARLASQQSSPVSSQASPAGTKRKNEVSGNSPSAKRGRKSSDKTQMTIEDSMATQSTEAKIDTAEEDGNSENKPIGHQSNGETDGKVEPSAEKANVGLEGVEQDSHESKVNDQSKEVRPENNEAESSNQSKEIKPENSEAKTGDQSEETKQADINHKVEPPKAEENSTTKQDHQDKPAQQTAEGNAVQPKDRDEDVPSSILEKGVIYFFFRPRVNVDEPQEVNDLARSYFVLRPIPLGAKLGDGPIGDDGNCRLMALPKKVLPVSGKDRFMTFVEKAKVSFKELRDEFLSGSEYATKTVGTRYTPPTTPVAEGVYALTSTGRESHLAYILTIPSELGEVQKDLGLRERGSFITSVKNPEHSGPANASLPEGPGYSEEILKEFRGLRWMPLQPKLLDYVNTQFLLIGESGGLEKALEEQPKDQKQDTDTPMEEIEKLEGEDEIRVNGLKGDDAVFADLGLSSQEYPKVPSTWN